MTDHIFTKVKSISFMRNDSDFIEIFTKKWIFQIMDMNDVYGDEEYVGQKLMHIEYLLWLIFRIRFQ